jgi:hypothetical protein
MAIWATPRRSYDIHSALETMTEPRGRIPVRAVSSRPGGGCRTSKPGQPTLRPCTLRW